MKMLAYKLPSLVTLLSLISCIHGPSLQETAASDLDSKQELIKLASDIQEARDAQVDLLADDYFRNAVEAFKKAQTNEASTQEVQETKMNLTKCRAYLAKANASAKVARSYLDDVIEARKLAVAAKANFHFPQE